MCTLWANVPKVTDYKYCFMDAYYFMALVSIVLSIVLPCKTNKQSVIKLIIVLFPLFIFGALRVDFGNDYAGYEESFEYFHSLGLLSIDSEAHAEFGYQILCQILPSYRSLLVLNALILCLALGIILYKCVPQEYIWLALLLIFLNPEKNIYGNLVGIRNGLVVTCFIIGFVYFLQKRKYKEFAVLTMLLYTIHTSTIFFLPIAYFVGNDGIMTKKEIQIWSFVAIVLLCFSMSDIINIVSPIISTHFDRYEGYIDDMGDGHRGTLIVLTNLVFIYGLIYTLYKNSNSLSRNENSLYRLGLLYLFFSFIGSLSMRASYFYDIFFILTIVSIFSDKRNPVVLRYGLLLLAIIVSYYSMFIVWMGSQWWNHDVYHSLIGDW